MSVPFEQLDRKTLDRLDLLRTEDSPQGLDRLLLQKILNLVYVTNLLDRTPHQVDVRAASDITSNGARLTAPIDKRRIIFSVRATLATTATAGNRNVVVDRRTKADSILNRLINETVAASTTRDYEISMVSSSNASIHRQLAYPMTLDPEQYFAIDDVADIANLDDVDWRIDFIEIPI